MVDYQTYEELFETQYIPKDILNGHPGFYKTYEETENYLNSIGITDGYKINKKTFVVDLLTHNYYGGRFHPKEYIKVKFGLVRGDFNCCYSELKSLYGCPDRVHGNFDAYTNRELKSLYGCPKIIIGNCGVSGCSLTDVLYSPEKIYGNFDIGYNKIISLWGLPELITGEVITHVNPIFTLKTKKTYKINNLDRHGKVEDESYRTINKEQQLNPSEKRELLESMIEEEPYTSNIINILSCLKKSDPKLYKAMELEDLENLSNTLKRVISSEW